MEEKGKVKEVRGTGNAGWESKSKNLIWENGRVKGKGRTEGGEREIGTGDMERAYIVGEGKRETGNQ
jgi:hypothetical protein